MGIALLAGHGLALVATTVSLDGIAMLLVNGGLALSLVAQWRRISRTDTVLRVTAAGEVSWITPGAETPVVGGALLPGGVTLSGGRGAAWFVTADAIPPAGMRATRRALLWSRGPCGATSSGKSG